MSISVSSLLEKMNDRDKDFRYMAISDLVSELEKDSFKLDPDGEKKIVSKLLDLVIKDASGDVQGLAVKCLGPLSGRVNEERIQEIVERLGTQLLDGKKEEMRDICSIGLKTVIQEIPGKKMGKLVVKKLTPRLIEALKKKDAPTDIQLYTLELLHDLLGRFRSLMSDYYEKAQNVCIPQLTNSRSASRKKAIGCLGFLSLNSPEALFGTLVDTLLSKTEKSKKGDHIRTFIQCIGAISRAVGFRLGKHMERIMAIVLKYADSDDFEEDDELRENCFQTFESLVLRCPKESGAYLDKIEALCLKYVKHDPNYNYDSGDESDEMDIDGMDDDEFDDGEDDEWDDYSDDDDMSWKVRKASSRCLAAMIQARPERLQHIYETVAPILISRFKEREENVRLDIYHTFTALLKQTKVVASSSDVAQNLLEQNVEKIISNVCPEFNNKKLSKNVKTRVAVLQTLRELLTVVPGCFTQELLGKIIPGIDLALGKKNTSSPLKIECLQFLRALLSTTSPAQFTEHLDALTEPVYNSVKDPYFKITAESLRVCQEFAKVLRSEEGAGTWEARAQALYAAVLVKLEAQDIDQEVKEQAITAAGVIVARLGDGLKGELGSCLKILLDRLGNEITRLTTVKALNTIATSSLKIDLSSILGKTVEQLASFLRKQNRQLKQSSLKALAELVKTYGKSKEASRQYEAVLKELAQLIGEADLHLSHLSIRVCRQILRVHSSSGSTINTIVLPKVLVLLTSSLLQGLALESSLSLFTEMVTSKSKKLTYDGLMSGLLNLVGSKKSDSKELSKQAFSCISQCVAAIAAKATEDQRSATVQQFIADVKSKKTAENKRLLALHCLGEVGRQTDLGAVSGLKKVVLSCFDSSSEEIKNAASLGLGGIATGNLKKFLPDILDEINKHPRKQYLLLGSLREIIVRQVESSKGAKRLGPFVQPLLDLLFKHTESDEEGTRNVIAECLGKLCIISPEKILPVLKEKSGSKNENTRSCVVTAVKYTISDKTVGKDVEKMLQEEILAFLVLLKDSEINVRRSALLTLNYFAHHRSGLIQDHLTEYLPVLYGETNIKPELIREVNLGPFKHKVDDGLDLRKAGFECMYTLLETAIAKIEFSAFIAQIVSGLSDDYDIKMLNHLILTRLANRTGAALQAGLEKLIEPLRKTITQKVRDGAVKQHVERSEELKRSALRAIVAISRIAGVDNNQKWADFMKNTVLVGAIGEKFNVISKELSENRDRLDLSASMEITRD